MDPKQQNLNNIYNQEDVVGDGNRFEQQFQNDDDFDQPRNIQQQSNQHSQGDIQDPQQLQESSKIHINESESEQFKSGSLKLSSKNKLVQHGQQISNVVTQQQNLERNQHIPQSVATHMPSIINVTETKTREASPNRYYSNEQSIPVGPVHSSQNNSHMLMSFGAMGPLRNQIGNVQAQNMSQITTQGFNQNISQRPPQNIQNFQNIKSIPGVSFAQKYSSSIPSSAIQPTISQTIIRSRVISQVQKPPIYISSPQQINLNQNIIKPQSQIISSRSQQRYSPLPYSINPTTNIQRTQQFPTMPLNIPRQMNQTTIVSAPINNFKQQPFYNRNSRIISQKQLPSREISPVGRQTTRITFNNTLPVQPTSNQQFLQMQPQIQSNTQYQTQHQSQQMQPHSQIQNQSQSSYRFGQGPAQQLTVFGNQVPQTQTSTYITQPQYQHNVQPQQTVSPITLPPLQFSHMQPQKNVIKFENWFIQSFTRYQQIATKIIKIYLSTHSITQMINTILQKQTQKSKQQYISHLLQQQNLLQRQLGGALDQLTILNVQNKQYKEKLSQSHNKEEENDSDNKQKKNVQFDNSQILMLREQCEAYQRQIVGLTEIINKRQLSSDRQNSQKSQGNSELSKNKLQLEKLKATNAKLDQTIQRLTKDNIDLRNRYQILQQQSESSSIGKTSIQDQLTKTIESQKIIIKKLEQQLIQANSISQSQQMMRSQTSNKQKSQLQKIYEGKRKAQQQKFMTIIQSKKAYINQLEAEIIRYKTQIKNLKATLKERQKLDKNFMLPTIDEKKSSNEDQSQKIRKMSLDQQKLQKTLHEKQSQLDAVKQKIFQFQEEFDKAIDQKNQKIKQLHQQIININKKGMSTELQPPGNGQTSNQSLPSFNADSSRPIINQQSKSENDKERMLLRTISSLQQQLNNKKEQINKIVKKISISQQIQSQFQKLKQLVTQKDEQLIALKKIVARNNQLQKQVQSQKKQRQQIQVVVQTLRKKENEIVKLRQTNQLHLTNIQQLQNQVAILTQKFHSIQDGLNQQRKESSHKQHTQQQQNQASPKQKQHKHHKESENDVQKLKKTIKQLKSRIKQMQDSHVEMGQRVIDAVEDEQDFRQQYSKSQVKIFELQAAVKSKQNRIKQLQTSIQTMKVKANYSNQTQQDLINQQQIQMLRKKVAEYQSRLNNTNNQNMIKNYKTRDYDSIHVFEQKVIYDLKTENERLKSLLDNTGTRWRFSHNQTLKHGKSRKNQQSQNHVVNIQRRLYEFNKRLQEMILENKQLQGSNRAYPPSKAVNHELVSLFEREKLVIVRRHQRQIQSLQARLIDLQRYCSTLENCQGLSYNFEYNNKQTTNEAQNIFMDQNSYYKDKNKQLQQRVDSLLILNKQLKSKLQQALRPGGDHNKDYYNQQISQLQKKIIDLQKRISTLTQQNSNFLKDLQIFKTDKSSHHKIQELQQKIQQLNLQILRLKQQNSVLDADVKKYAQQVKQSSTDALNSKTLLNQKQQKINSLQQLLKGHNTKSVDSQQQIIKLSNQLQILKAENQRLQQVLQGRKNQQEGQVSRLKSIINDLQKQIRDLREKSQYWQNRKFDSSQTINELNAKIQNLQTALRNQTQKSSGLNQKIRQLDYKNYQLQSELTKAQSLNYELELKLNQLKNQIVSLNGIINQLKQDKNLSLKNQNEINNLKSTIRRLTQQIQSLKVNISQITKSKQSIQIQNYGLKNQIQSLKLKLSQTQGKGIQKDQLSADIRYRLELIRSIFIEFQSLLSEIMIQQNIRQRQIVTKFRSQISVGFNLCEQVFVKL